MAKRKAVRMKVRRRPRRVGGLGLLYGRKKGKAEIRVEKKPVGKKLDVRA